MRHACVSPGSRSTPLALALDRHAGVTVHVHLDERSSAFFALGLAKALRRPVAVACTSGTAAAELFPAVVEASQARVPLYLLTADRPPRLRGTGANQTIDQVRLFGTYARAYLEPPVPASAADALAWRRIGREAVAACGGPQPGPVHINCSFEEPLVPAGDVVDVPGARPGARGARRIATPSRSRPTSIAPREELSGARGVVVAGIELVDGLERGRAARTAARVAAARGTHVGAPAAGVRRSRPVRRSSRRRRSSSGTGRRSCCRSAPRRRRARPRRSWPPPSGSSWSTCSTSTPTPSGRRRWRLRGRTRIGSRPELMHVAIQPAPEGLARVLAGRRRSTSAHAERWTSVLDATDEPTELRLARDLAAAVPEGGTLFVGNSMPIRDLDVAMAPRDGLQVLANRGASGIDGLVSTALGIATAGTGPTFALIGDLSFLYDAGALLWNGRRLPADLVLVVPNNRGGAIFGSLDQRDLPERDRLFVTPQDVDLAALCAAAGVGHARVERMSDLDGALARRARRAEASG